MTRDEARRRVMQRMGLLRTPRAGRKQLKVDTSRGMGAYPWYGAGLVGWYFGEADAQRLTQLVAVLRSMIAEVQAIVPSLPADLKGQYSDRLNAYSRTLDGILASVASKSVTKASYDSNEKLLSVTWPRELVALKNLAQRDVATKGQATTDKFEADRAAQAARDEAIKTNPLVHPIAAAQAAAESAYQSVLSAGGTVLEAGKAAAAAALKAAEEVAGKAADTAAGIQWKILKSFWPFLAIGGGVAVIWFFGPALSVIFKGMMAKRLAGRVPGELPPGTQHQPGE